MIMFHYIKVRGADIKKGGEDMMESAVSIIEKIRSKLVVADTDKMVLEFHDTRNYLRCIRYLEFEKPEEFFLVIK